MRFIVVILSLLVGFSQELRARSFDQETGKPVGVLDTLMQHCGKAFLGEVTRYGTSDDAWRKARLIMHIRDCSDGQIKVPLHVGDDRSRIWVISKTENGLRLKHDHRHADGTEDAVTQYGGESTAEAAQTATLVSFPVDQESITMFKDNGLTASVSNVWHISVTGDLFHYRLTRENRDFMVTFDLSKPIDLPPAAWDLASPQ
ncbi:MAG: hypothetical protein COB37_07050 [Kordiimonadales bacterium]|nr:MAG: hypothetical protein COB37_07050 [Kordiimonadales bacterium]